MLVPNIRAGIRLQHELAQKLFEELSAAYAVRVGYPNTQTERGE